MMNRSGLDRPDLVYAVSGKYLGAFNLQSGQLAWSVKVKTGWFGGGGIAAIVVIGDTLVMGRDGRVFGFDRWTGRQLWENRLEGSGMYATILAGADTSSGAAAAVSQSAANAAQSAAAVASIAAMSAASS